MAEENQDGQEKTEEPSQRKIDKHKEDGKVLKGPKYREPNLKETLYGEENGK